MRSHDVLDRSPPIAAAAAVLGLLLAACGAGAQDDEDGANADVDADPAASEQSATASAVAAADSLPAAIVGEAGPPTGEHVNYFTADPDTRGYLAVPEGEGPFPAVVLIHEWNGLVDRIRQFADAMAEEGYVALAADLYSGRTGDSPEENRALVAEVQENEDRMIANLNAAVEFLRGRDDVTGRVATIGWCFGGGVALSYALGGERHEGTAIFYGSLIDDPERLRSIGHEVYGTFGELDTGIPPEAVERFVGALREAGVPNDVHIYDGVGHAFWLYVEQDPEARAGPAADAWSRLEAYLGRVLGGTAPSA
ncbi:MAG: dienelactone hydrolase family protein [Gemmatimonadota bacterium]